MKPLFLSLWIAGLTACASPSPPARDQSPQASVTLVRAEARNLAEQFEAGGVLRARLMSPIASRVLAPITEIRVRPGDRVRRGQTLVVLDGRELHAQSERAAAALVAAQHGVQAADAEKPAASAVLTLATASYDRIKGLHARRSATNQELDEAVASLESARARATGAEAHAAEAAAALTAAQSAASAAAIAASYATLTAPFDGVITERSADPGTMASPGAPLLMLEDTSSFRIEVRLDEARASHIAVGQNAEIHIDAATPDVWRAGRVAEVSHIDPAGRGFVVKIDVPLSPALRSGAFGRARFAGAPRAALTAPASALIRRGQMTFVFAVDGDGLARLRPVTAGPASGDRIEVLAGVKDGEELVVNPPASLADGTRIRPGGRP